MRSMLSGAIVVAMLLVAQVASAQFAPFGMADSQSRMTAGPGMSQPSGIPHLAGIPQPQPMPQAAGAAYATATDYPQPSSSPIVDPAVQLASAQEPLSDIGASCATGGCDVGCDLGGDCGCGESCGCGIGCGSSCGCCTAPVWAHRCGVFGEYLYLRPRNAEIVYAVPFNGPVTSPPDAAIQIIGFIDHDKITGKILNRFQMTRRTSVSGLCLIIQILQDGG